MSGGGKGDHPEPIYKPQYSGQLEKLQAASSLGAAVKANPALAAQISPETYASFGIQSGMPTKPAELTGFMANNPVMRQIHEKDLADYNQKMASWTAGGGASSAEQLAKLSPDLPKPDYQKFQDMLTSGKLANGQSIPQYQPSQAYQFTNPNYQAASMDKFNFTTPNISNIPQQAYTGVLNQGMEKIQQAQQAGSQQANQSYGARGLGKSGMLQGAQSSLARGAQEQASGLARDVGYQQAQSQLDVGKTQAAMEQQRQQSQAGYNQNASQFGEQSRQFGANLGNQYQQMQAGENARQSQASLQAQQILSGLGLQQIGALGSLQGQQAQAAMQPYQMLSSLYGQNIGIPVPSYSGSKGDPFSALLQAGGTVAGAALGRPAGAAAGSALGSLPTVMGRA